MRQSSSASGQPHVRHLVNAFAAVVLIVPLLSLNAIHASKHVSASTTYATAIEGDSPVAFYQLNDSSCCDAVDSSSNDYTASYDSSGITYGVSGPAGADGINITTGEDAVTQEDTYLPSGNSSRSVELWMNTTTYTAGAVLFSYGTFTGDTNDGVELTEQGQYLSLNTDGSGHINNTGEAYFCPYDAAEDYLNEWLYGPDWQELTNTSSVSAIASEEEIQAEVDSEADLAEDDSDI